MTDQSWHGTVTRLTILRSAALHPPTVLPDKRICFEVVLVIYWVVGVKRSTPGWQQDEEDTVRSGVEDTFVWGTDVRIVCVRQSVLR